MPEKRVAVLQSNYIPWKGYFDIIHDVELFVFYDEVQYTKNDWRNRNVIYTESGLKWITLPCGYDLKRKIIDVRIKTEVDWQNDHLKRLCTCYAKAPYFFKYKPFFEHAYLERKWEYLSELNKFLIKHISTEYLGIKTEFADSRDYDSCGHKSEKLLSLLLSAGCGEYLSGPAARDYLDEDAFISKGIKVLWKDYSGYPKYRQLHEPFEHGVSVIDLLFNTGPDAPYYIWGWREG